MIQDELNKLAQMKAQADLLQMDYNAKRDAVLVTVKAELDALAEEYQPMLDAIQQNMSALETIIKAAVVQEGASVKGDFCQVVYAKGRISWDTKAIEGYAAGHPEILQFRKECEPSVSIRWYK